MPAVSRQGSSEDSGTAPCHTEAAAALPWTSRRRAKRERPPGAVLKGLRGDGNRSDLRLQDW